jgi:hypothetical protein
MKENFNTRIYGWFYGSSCKKLISNQFGKQKYKEISKEYRRIIVNAKNIGKSRLISAYCMAAYFIALNRKTGISAEDNYQLFKNGLYSNKLFHKALGDAESYLDKKKLPGRLKWSKESHQRKYENDWVVDILDETDNYILGYDYLECGICKLCKDEGCFELAQYLCRLDYVLADIMGMKLERTMTIAEGCEKCDFRYSRKG